MSIKDQIPIDKKLWYAVRCKFRCEKRLARDLFEKGIEVYVPIQKKIVPYKSRNKRSEVPLIPSHIFVKIERSSYVSVLKHPFSFRFLHFGGIISPIPENEIILMKRVVGESNNVRIDNLKYRIGDRVQIIGGELTGIIGVLIEETNHNFKIELGSLGMGLIIYVDPKDLMKFAITNKVA